MLFFLDENDQKYLKGKLKQLDSRLPATPRGSKTAEKSSDYEDHMPFFIGYPQSVFSAGALPGGSTVSVRWGPAHPDDSGGVDYLEPIEVHWALNDCDISDLCSATYYLGYYYVNPVSCTVAAAMPEILLPTSNTLDLLRQLVREEVQRATSTK